MYTKEFIIDEISYYNDYDIDFLKTKSEEELNVIFNSHCETYSVEVKAKDLVDNYQNIDFLMSSPDGYLNVGDFWIKHKKDIITIRTSDSFTATVSIDHLFETPSGWVHAGKLLKGDLVLTKDGFRQIKYINIWNNPEDVYDWEILHDNHRYWAGNGISSHNTGKTYLTLNAVKQAQDLGYYIVYYDSENAVDRDLVEKFGIDSTKFRYEPCNTVQEFRSSITTLADTLIANQEKGLAIPKVMVVLDSAGNLATQKEIDDARSGSDKADMTRSKLLKSTFRILMTKLGIIKVPFLFTNHTYQTQDLFSQTVSGGGTGPEYAASIILFLGKAKLKEGTEQTGIIVSAKPNKNRFAKPTPIKFHISFNKGMNPYIGLEEYISWDTCGIQRGRLLTEGQYDKLKEGEKVDCRRHDYEADGKDYTCYFQPSETARKIAVAHLNDTVDLNQLYTPQVITREVLDKLEPIVNQKFRYGSDELSINDLDVMLNTNDED